MPGESYGPRSLVGYSPLGRNESDMTNTTQGIWYLSSPTRDQTHVPLVLEAWIPNHWTTREVP